MGQFNIFVYTPAGSNDTALSIAACRAGGVGVINAELGASPDLILHQLDYLSQMTSGEYGLKLGAWDAQLLSGLIGHAQKGLRWLILDCEIVPACQKHIVELKQNGVSILAEIKTLDWPENSLEQIVDGLILKGNESGGFVGENSSFILLQKWFKQTQLPLIIRGGVSPSIASACSALGVHGCVLDSQVLLLDESPFAHDLNSLLGNLSGSETANVGSNTEGHYFRLLVRPGNQVAKSFCNEGDGQNTENLQELVKDKINWEIPMDGLLPIGQDVCFAGKWRKKYGHMAAVFQAINSAVDNRLPSTIEGISLLDKGSLAQTIGTDLPLVQGPMARVSDCIEFAIAVYEGGALPVMALSFLKGKALNSLIEKTAKAFVNKSWGVGFLGFAPQALLDDQMAIAKKYKPKVAIIAGGRPDQVAIFEKTGMISFMHIPSAELIPLFIQEGARRFIFEGSECGGHIGPLSSFILWSTMVDSLFAEITNGDVKGEDIQVLFAGGIHDAFSSALVQALAAPLVQRGVKIGILMGSGYLFTKEIVDTGAIVATFQEEVIKCKHTVTLESAPGHANRCSYTNFAQSFLSKRKELFENNIPGHTIKNILDDFVMGKLRIASKGCDRVNGSNKLIAFDESYQKREGMYMLGQLATLRSEITNIATLHSEVTEDASRLLDECINDQKPAGTGSGKPADIAVIGIASTLPKAKVTQDFWENIIAKVDAITEIPSHRWDWRLYYDKDRYAKDKIYSKWGGFMDDFVFDPTLYGIPPKSIETIDPMQLMALDVARRSLVDAGYEKRPFDREQASVIIGNSSSGDVGLQYGLRAELPRFMGNLPDSVAERLPEWSEDTFAGILSNVVAGRIANRLNLGGSNYTIDAACASSMAAIYQGVNELSARRSSLVIAGGVDTVQGPFSYMCFSKTQALSPRGSCNTFDSSSDGIVLAEGIAMVVLKRLEDAERDGDKIYAVIKGVGSSSDGRAMGLTAPLPAGQLRSMNRAYEQAGFGPDTVGMFEAHGTGTVAGDTAELESTISLIKESGARPHQAMIGSVKTMIGHTKSTAGIAGLIKATLALHHRVLPPHSGVKEPNQVLQETDNPLYLIDEAMPWLTIKDQPRRAAASAFGFGGTNFHIVLEEYMSEYRSWMRPALSQRWPAELLLWSEVDGKTLTSQLSDLRQQLETITGIELRDLAYNLSKLWEEGKETVAIIAKDSNDLAKKIDAALSYMDKQISSLPLGVYHGKGAEDNNKLAVLFSGQGAQYTGMFRELAVNFPVLSETLSEGDELLKECFDERFGQEARLSHFIYPRGSYSDQAKSDAARALTRTDVAQPALGAVEAGLWKLMSSMGLEPDMVGGHSYGEFVALFASGIFDFDVLMSLSEARGRFIFDSVKDADSDLGRMFAVKASRGYVEKVISGIDGVFMANHNAPQQIIISGSESAIKKAVKKMADDRVAATELPVTVAFHTPIVEPSQILLADLIEKTVWRDGKIPVYSNTTGKLHAKEINKIKQVMTDHLVKPVEFQSQIETMYRDGARVFLELGPKSILTGLVRRILKNRPYKAVTIDSQGGGINGFLHTLGQLLCAGIRLDTTKLFEGRSCINGDPGHLIQMQRNVSVPKHAWMLNGSRARRATAPVEQIGIRKDESGSCSPCLPQDEIPSSAPANNLTYNSSLRTKKYQKEKLLMGSDKHSPVAGDSAVMVEYFDMMRKFLETQESIMSLYMGGKPTGRLPGYLSTRHTKRQTFQRNTEPEQSKFARPTDLSIRSEIIGAPFAETPEQVEETHFVAEDQKKNFASSMPQKVSNKAAPLKEPSENIDREKITDLLLTIVEDKTGYPRELIGLNQKLETDLGIDSIKRTQVVGALLKALPQNYRQAIGEEDRTSLSTQATLDGMISLLAEICLEGEKTVPFLNAGTGAMACKSSHPFRHVIEPKQEFIDASALKSLGQGHFIITQDNLGVAEKLSEMLMARNCTISIVKHEILKDENLLNQWCASVDNQIKSITGIVHLIQIGSGWIQTGASVDEWRSQLQCNEKSFFILLRYFSSKIKSDAHIMSASALGGFFSRKSINIPGLSLQGGAVGLLKSLLEERPNLRVKAVDLDSEQQVDKLATSLLNELELAGGRQEVGYPKGERNIFQTIPQSVKESDESLYTICDMVVLATGGTKGVTAELLRELAIPGNTLLLTGRSARPENEPESLHSLITPSLLRSHFVSEVRSGRLKQTPAEIERKIKSILSDREMRNNIEDFQARGAKVEYFSVDATNDDAMRQLLDEIYNRYKKINVVVHGAGIIEDKFLEDKTSESWSRVVETKVMGLLLLQKYLRQESLEFFTVLSSVAGRYGNSGQSDYATANELMNRLCSQLYSNWGNRIKFKALCWGPWASTTFGAGMVTKETEAKFAEKGVTLVSTDAGRKLFREELTLCDGDSVEIICGEGPWEKAEDIKGKIQKEPLAEIGNVMGGMINNARLSTSPDEKHIFTFPLGENHAYLQEHYIDDVPVMPAAAALEIMSEAAAHLWPDLFVVEAFDFRLLKGIQVKEENQKLSVILIPEFCDNSFQVNAIIQSEQIKGIEQIHYRSVLRLDQKVPNGFKHDLPSHNEKKLTIAKAYDEWLFHGPRFQVIEKIYGLSKGGAHAKVRSSSPEQWLVNVEHGYNKWVFDPALVDAAAQMALLWTRSFCNESALPTGFGRVIRYSEILPEKLYMQFERILSEEFHSIHANIYFSDEDNNVVLQIENMECVSSAELNRLGGVIGNPNLKTGT